jgi:pyruvate dehydrogenase E2 component (dihydrolipoamide acetyltransferase)
MATPVRMPKLGMSMREGTVVDWPRATGDAVAKGEVLLVIESEKAEVEVEATASGVLAHIYVEVGQTVPCGTLLAALVEDAGEAFDAEAFRAEQDAVSPSAEAAGYGGVGDQGRAVVGSPSAQGEGAQRSDRRRPVAPVPANSAWISIASRAAARADASPAPTSMPGSPPAAIWSRWRRGSAWKCRRRAAAIPC